jgi:hypothetical protein
VGVKKTKVRSPQDESIAQFLKELDSRIADHRMQAHKHRGEATRHEQAAAEAEAVRSIALGKLSPLSPASKGQKAEADFSSESIGPYTGMPIRLAAIKYLRDKGSPAGTAVIADELQSGGIETTSKYFYRTLFNILTQASRRQKPIIRKEGDKWRLTEWESVS